MGEVPEIVDLHRVVEPYLDGGQLVSYSSRYLTKPGDNYGSIMLAISANVKRQNGDIEELPLVAKLPPITNDLYWKIFHPERTCVTENATYKYLAPALRKLQLEADVPESQLFDDFSKYYGSRISLDDKATVVDRSAVLVQENLTTSGYKPGNRHQMFDYAHTKLVIEHMAQYHALPIALRKKKPEEFDKYIRPYYHRFNMNDSMGPEMKEQFYEETIKEIEIVTNNNEKIVQRVRKLMDTYDELLTLPDAADSLYTTICHCDMWINNLMIQYDENGAPSKLKFLDFQIAQYESLAHDVVFFLFSSVDSQVLEDHYYDFLKMYYKEFLACLKSVHVSIEEYSLESFMAEVKSIAPIQMPHTFFMTKIILADANTMPEDFKDMNMEVISKNVGLERIVTKLGDILRLAQKFDFFF